MNQIKARQIRTFRTPDNGEGEPVRVIRIEGDRAIVKFLTGYIGTGSVPLESLV